ncbi:protein-L-isoaspartate(D-aspartate) O-methyltransferase [Oligoflexia bacterium]|nr:protein-L-isoaspartate(D-aspartate) O-methyltransferase [Oligoflexia bacterium]
MNASEESKYKKLRIEMVETQIERRNITDQAVLNAMKTVPRHLFVPEEQRTEAYADRALPLGPDQTISQPYIVGCMLAAAELTKTDRVLEIGTGSGYQAVVLSYLAQAVYSVEIDGAMLCQAQEQMAHCHTDNVFVKVGDGYLGWSEHAPYDAIIVSAAPSQIPRELLKQLKEGGRMVLPLGATAQELIVIKKTSHGLDTKELGAVRFVPMIGG